MKKKVFVWSTEHSDLVWRRCFDRDFIYKGQNFVSYADLEAYYIIDNIKLCDDNKDYRFTVESVAMLKKFLEHYPEYDSKIAELIKTGQLQMPFTGTCIVDSNMVNGEGIVRNFLYGREYLKNKYNYIPYGIDRNDAFGNSAQMPQIARGFGTKWMFEIAYSRPDNLYWEGLDGSRVLTWMPEKEGYTGGYYKYRPCPECNGFKDRDCPSCSNRRIDTKLMEEMRVKLSGDFINNNTSTPSMIYCGGEEILPGRYIFDWIKENEDKYDIEFANYDAYIPYIKDMLDRVDTAGEEELHSSKEINCNNTGTYVTRINTKKTVRDNENALLSLETLAVADCLKNKSYPYEEIEDIWDKYFFTIFHDSIPATHVNAAYDEIMDCAKEIKEKIIAEKDKILTENTTVADNTITVYNPYGSTVSNEVTLTVKSKDDISIKDADGNRISIVGYEKDANEIKVTFLVNNLEAFSKRIYSIEKNTMPYLKDIKSVYELNEFTGKPVLTNEVTDIAVAEDFETEIENDSFKIRACHNGIREIYDKKLKKTITSESEYMVGEFILEHDEGSPWSTHSTDMHRYPLGKHTHLLRIEKTEDTQKLVFVVRPGDIDGNAVMGLRITYNVILKRGSDKVHFETDVFWHTQNYRLRVAMPSAGDARHFYDIPYGVIERKPYEPTIVFPNGAINWASAAGDYPAINFAGIQKEDYSLAMFNKGTPSYQINKDKNDNTVIYLSLLRSPTIGSYLNSPTEYAMLDYDGMQDCGNHHFEYAIKAYDKGYDQNCAACDGVAYNAQLTAVNGVLDFPELIRLECNDARISSIKMSQDKKGIIVRINEYHGKDTEGMLVIPENIKAKGIWQADLKEDKQRQLKSNNGKVKLDIRHFEIKTVYIEI